MKPETFVVKGEVLASIYGPVQSRRHGLSLGINVGLTEHKVCTWSCLYCQCGFGERRDYTAEETRISADDLLLKVRAAAIGNSELAAVTLAGNTEPGTYPEILPFLKGLKRLKLASRSRWKIIVLSNGSELDRDEVVQAFSNADEVWFKLDTGTEEQFHILNRPLPKVGQLRDHLNRLKKIPNLRIQTMIWENDKEPKRSNANEENFLGLLACYAELNPIQVNLTTVARDPALPGVIPVSNEVLQAFAERIRKQNITTEVLI